MGNLSSSKVTYSDKINGTEVNYLYLCERRCWLARHNVWITEDSPHIREGRVISSRKRSGHEELKLGRNKFDVISGKENNLEVHEYKKSSYSYKSSLMQLLHYLYCLEEYGTEAVGVLHLLGSRETEKKKLDEENREELVRAYQEILSLDKGEIPTTEEIPICHKGCSFEEYCWG